MRLRGCGRCEILLPSCVTSIANPISSIFVIVLGCIRAALIGDCLFRCPSRTLDIDAYISIHYPSFQATACITSPTKKIITLAPTPSRT